MVYFISGHLDLTDKEFEEHYRPRIEAAITEGAEFFVGDARGADTKAQQFLMWKGCLVIVYHMLQTPRNNTGFATEGGFTSDEERDAAMTRDSDADIAWVRPGRENSGTAKNMKRRQDTTSEPVGECLNEPGEVRTLVNPIANPDYAGLCLTCAFAKWFRRGRAQPIACIECEIGRACHVHGENLDD
jgi:hypothetical protein